MPTQVDFIWLSFLPSYTSRYIFNFLINITCNERVLFDITHLLLGLSSQGISLLTMSQLIPSLKPCNNEICDRTRKVHEVVFFLALYCIALGTGGFRPSLQSFGADQFDDDHLEERKMKMSFFNWWSFTLCSGIVSGATVVVYVQDFVSWGVAFLILTICMALTIIIFYMGMPFYRYRRTEGNPLMQILQVLIAAIRKRNLICPLNPALLHEIPKSENSQGRLLSHTSRLRYGSNMHLIRYIEYDPFWFKSFYFINRL